MGCSTCKVKHSDYHSQNLFNWCTNCGNYGINGAVKRALVDEQIAPHEVVLCHDIGCNGNGADKINGYTVHGLHGRVLPFASGVSLADNKRTVIASAGDGATLGEGINHLIHAIRNNYNFTFLLHNNENYGLTTGQASPTTRPGNKMNSSPEGVSSPPIHVLDLVFSLEPTFVARSWSGDVKQLSYLIQRAINHDGFSFIEILQDCPSYNKATPHEWYQERVYDVSTIMNYDIRDKENARKVATDIYEKIATGVLYVDDSRKDMLSNIPSREGIETELVDQVKSYEGLAMELFADFV